MPTVNSVESVRVDGRVSGWAGGSGGAGGGGGGVCVLVLVM